MKFISFLRNLFRRLFARKREEPIVVKVRQHSASLRKLRKAERQNVRYARMHNRKGSHV